MNNIRPTNTRKKRHREAQCYESPLSSKERHLRNLVYLIYGERRLTRGMVQKLKGQNAVSLSRESPSRNSIIVINDSDNETRDNETSGKDKEEDASSLSIIECSPTMPSSSRKLRKKESQNSLRQNKNRSLISLSNLSIIESSSTQSQCNGENIAPSKTEDDVIELWSSLKNASSPNKRRKSTRYYHDEPNEKVNFVVDVRPNLKNLELLKTNTEPVRKKRKLCHKFDKVTLSSNKCRRKKQHANSADSNLSESNARSREEETKTIVSGVRNSRDSSNKLQETTLKETTQHKLREIIVDGCNVAMAHTHHQTFSLKGIQLVVDYFKLRGHDVKVFLPQYLRKREYTLLEEFYRKGIVVFTPSRKIAGRQITSHDDWYILEYATACGGIVISSDQYRDWYEEKPEWRDTILNRLLTPTFVGDYVMFPEDPLGRFGPNLETFLRH
ncbi:unnamed protein product [Lasius platythorax]|uniref:RNase NYN domain-containing protein n=1 Tax=Lasius platythorax TaxID=488582 RepID=A0AAV2PAF9_9HYME